MTDLLKLGISRRVVPVAAREPPEPTRPAQRRKRQLSLVPRRIPELSAGRALLCDAVGSERVESYDVRRFVAHARTQAYGPHPLTKYEVVPFRRHVRALFHVVSDDDAAVGDAARAALALCRERGWGGTAATVLRVGRRGVRILVDCRCPSLAAAAEELRLRWRVGPVEDFPCPAAGVLGRTDDDSPLYVLAPFCGRPPVTPFVHDEDDPASLFVTAPADPR